MRASVLAVILASILPGCGPSTPTTAPDEAAAGSGGVREPAADGVMLRYPVEPIALAQTTDFSMAQSGGGVFGRASLAVTAGLELAPRDDALGLVWSVEKVDAIELEGTLASDEDPAAIGAFVVEHGKGAHLVNRTGVRDEAASRRLPENEAALARLQKLQAEAGAGALPARGQLLAFMPMILALPELPEAGLSVGEPVTVEEKQEIELQGQGIVLPSQSTRTYTLIKIDASGASRIAEVKIDSRSGGELETQEGMLVIDSVSEGTLLFDLDRRIPVAYDVSRTESFSFGEQTGESTTVVQTLWERD